jgi:hypothetical protein
METTESVDFVLILSSHLHFFAASYSLIFFRELLILSALAALINLEII